MDKTAKKHKKDFEKWLLMFEKLTGGPCVVSLLIQKQEVNFILCINKNKYFDIDAPEEASSEVDLDELKSDIKGFHLGFKNYIG